ncbi:MAG: MEKHLA domain-containing protein [Bacteroidetes bacterium]|nr:MEKHLA domain-containing protein [Bacteroidota bacterium]MBL6943027.1 MEKHLA domain-containing protein [Bacteroidales bacterium]
MVLRKSDELSILRKKAAEKLAKEMEEIQNLSVEELKSRYFEISGSEAGLKELEIKFKNKIEELQTIFHASHNSIWYKDTKNNFIRVNQAAAKIAGLEIDEIEGRSADEIFPLESEKYYKDDLEVIKTGNPKIGIIESYTTKGTTRWVRTDKIPWYTAFGEIAGIIAFARDITERKQAEAILNARTSILEFSFHSNLEQLLQKTLDEIETLTNSKIGFYHFVEADQKTLSLQVWSTNTINNMCTTQAEKRHYNVDEAGVWVDCVHTRSAVIHNDYEKLPRKKGLPDGHAQVIRELVVPIFRNEKIVAILGVGNKEINYNETDVRITTQIADLAWGIAEQKRAEEAFSKSEALYLDLVETSQDLIWRCNAEGRYLYLNPVWEKVFGYTVEEMLGKRFSDFQTTEMAARDLQEHARLMQGNSVKGFETVHIGKSGNEIHLVFNAKFLTDANGNITGTRGTAYDITERKRAEEQTKQLNEYLQLQIKRMPIGLITWDNEFRVKLWNPAAEKIFGFTQEEALGKHPYDFIVPKEEQLVVDDVWRRLLEGDETAHSVNSNITKDGQNIICSWTNTPLKDNGGKTIGVLAMVQNITERSQAEEEQRRLVMMLDAAPSAITIHDTDGQFFYANQRALDMHGYTRDEFLSLTTHELDVPESKELFESNVKKLLDQGKINIEVSHFMKNGTILPLEIFGKLTTWGDKKVILSIATDITERKQAEKQLSSLMNRLIESEELMRRTVAQQLHDQVGQNLTALTINLNFIQTQIAEKQKSKIDKRLTDSLDILTETIEQTRNIMVELRPSVLDDYGLNSALSWSLNKFAERVDINVVYNGNDLSKRLPINKEFTMFRVFQEAIHNIIKHAQAKNVAVALEETGDLVIMSIQDDGVGFDLDELKHKKEQPGLGIISMAERIKIIDGKLEISAETGKGTTITVEVKR